MSFRGKYKYYNMDTAMAIALNICNVDSKKKYSDANQKMLKKLNRSSMLGMDTVMPNALCISNQVSLVLLVCP